MPAQGAALPARAAESRADAAARDDELVAEPAPGDQLRAVPATGAGVSVEPIPMIEGIMLPGGMWNSAWGVICVAWITVSGGNRLAVFSIR